MSDFIDGLRGDLVDAADLHRRRSRARRTWQRFPALGRPALAAATAVAGALAVIVVASMLAQPHVASPEITARLQIGGQPQDAVFADGALWVTDFTGRLIRVDPTGRKVTGRFDIDGNPHAIAAGPGGIWAISPGLDGEADASLLSRIDGTSGQIVQRIRVSGYVDGLAVGAGGVWTIDRQRRQLDRIDPASGGQTASVPFARGGALAATRDTLWAIAENGALVAVDAATLAADRLTGAVAFGHGPGENTLTAGAEGAWVVGRGDGTVLRIDGGRVVSRVPVPQARGPIALGDGIVWVVSGEMNEGQGAYRLTSIDRDTDAVIGTLEIGFSQPKALVATGRDVWVITADGSAMQITT